MSYYYDSRVDFSELEGQTILGFDVRADGMGDVIVITTAEGNKYKMMHMQDCCENVRVEDITGDLGSLLGEKVVQAYETTNRDQEPPEWRDYGSFTWTFYDIATHKGYVTIRWLGTSNGYYSERVDLIKVSEGEDDG